MTTKTEILRAIRVHCLECCSNSAIDVANCTAGASVNGSYLCGLYPYRFGKDPKPNPKNVERGRQTGEKYGFKKTQVDP